MISNSLRPFIAHLPILGNCIGQTYPMPRGRKKSQVNSTLTRPRPRLRKVDASAWVRELVRLHVAVDRRAEDLDAADPYAVLIYAERHSRQLGEEERKAAAVLRAKLAQFVRERMDALQLQAVEEGRLLQVPWRQFHEALCVTSDNGAYNAARRLKAESLRRYGEPRTPEMAMLLEARIREEELLQATSVVKAQGRHKAVYEAATVLLANRAHLALDDSEEDSWADSLAQLLDDCDTPAAQAALAGCLRMLLEEISEQAELMGAEPATSAEARSALADAVRVVADH